MENFVKNLIDAERERQNEKWGEQNHGDYRWLAILAEEVGELAQAILHDEFGGPHAGTAETELVQVAAVAVQWLECMERRLTPLAEDADTPKIFDPERIMACGHEQKYIVYSQRHNFCGICGQDARLMRLPFDPTGIES